MRKTYLALIAVVFASTAFATPALARSHDRTHTGQSPAAPAKRHARPNGTRHHKSAKSSTSDADAQDLILVPVLNGQPNPNNDEAMDSDDGTFEQPADGITLQDAIVVLIPNVNTYAPVISDPT
ncbi:MAG: hypothetical protein JWL75_347 [Parcubacteria group bacterium]|nr:hypothetical protein [Parcubacteria group bacterium]